MSSFLSIAHTISDVQALLSKRNEDSTIFVDVDDTLITPTSALFRALSPYRSLIDELKRDREKFGNFETILSHWRLQRKTMLVSEEWPHLLNELKQRNPVYALTQMETGTLEEIPSMEEWRHEELTRKGIVFTPSFNGKAKETLLVEPLASYPALFYQGIFITGSFNKSDVLRAFLKTQSPSQIVLIDDRLEQLEDVEKECSRQALSFLGIHFKGAELITGAPDPQIAAFQKKHLFEYAQWLEDEEAEGRCNS